MIAVSFPLPFMTAASPCCLLLLWDLFCLPPKVPLMVVSVHHTSIRSPQLFPFYTPWGPHPGPRLLCCHTNSPHTFLFPSSLSQSSILSSGPASPAGVLKNLNFNSSTKWTYHLPLFKVHLWVPRISHPNQKPGSHSECHLFHHLIQLSVTKSCECYLLKAFKLASSFPSRLPVSQLCSYRILLEYLQLPSHCSFHWPPPTPSQPEIANLNN